MGNLNPERCPSERAGNGTRAQVFRRQGLEHSLSALPGCLGRSDLAGAWPALCPHDRRWAECLHALYPGALLIALPLSVAVGTALRCGFSPELPSCLSPGSWTAPCLGSLQRRGYTIVSVPGWRRSSTPPPPSLPGVPAGWQIGWRPPPHPPSPHAMPLLSSVCVCVCVCVCVFAVGLLLFNETFKHTQE